MTRSRGGPRIAVFAGKGGVGKTTCAAAAAMHAARDGEVLLLAGDGDEGLADVLARPVANEPAALDGYPRSLLVARIDAAAAWRRWLSVHEDALRAALRSGSLATDATVERFLALPVPGTEELFGLLEVTRLADARPAAHVIVDAAATGALLRVLRGPAALEHAAAMLNALDARGRAIGAPTPAPLQHLVSRLEADHERLTALMGDPARCAVAWVALAEDLSIEETVDGIATVRGCGIAVDRLVVARLARARPGCARCQARAAEQWQRLVRLEAAAGGIPVRVTPERERPPRGRRALEALGARLAAPPPRASPPPAPVPVPSTTDEAGDPGAARVPDGVELALFAGAGGVGKTTCAAAAALASATARRRVLVLSVDPAHSLGDALDRAVGPEPVAVEAVTGLHAQELRAVAARRHYHAVVTAAFDAVRTRRADLALDRSAAHAMVDAAPPALDEADALLAVPDALGLGTAGPAPHDLVVLDPPPAGHALRLLALPAVALEWVRVLRDALGDLPTHEPIALEALLDLARRLRAVQTLLADPRRTWCAVVARADDLRVAPVTRLRDALESIGLDVAAIIVQGSRRGTCAACRRAAALQQRQVAELATALAPGVAIICTPERIPPPRGSQALLAWGRAWRRRPNTAR